MKVLNNTFLLLDLFLDNGTEISLDDLSRLSGINKTTISRIVSELIQHGYLMQRKKKGMYSLGYKYFDFTGYIKNQIRERDIAIPFLMKLTQVVDESVIMAIWSGGIAAITESFHANHALKVVPDEGGGLPLHSTSLGKVILANISESELDEIYQNQPLERLTPNTITDLDDLKSHLALIKREGVAFDDEENNPGVRGVGAELRNFDGNIVGAIGVIGPSVRLTREKLRELVAPVRACADNISHALGLPKNNRKQ